MNIRAMVKSDLGQIVPLAAQLGHSATCEELASRFVLVNSNPSAALMVAESREAGIIGFITLHEVSTLLSARRVEIQALVVDRAHRGQGVGQALVAAAEAWTIARGLQHLRLGSRTSRTEAHKFYQRVGFTIDKTWFVFGKTLFAPQTESATAPEI
jgi:ribosomal protein S18 acetylase RimI-like enzyme